MLGYIIKKVFGSKNDREVRKLRPIVTKINELEQALQGLPEEALRQKTAEWKAKLSTIQDKDELARELNLILPEAFAVVKNACRRLVGSEITVRGHKLKWDMVPFDVQAIGGWALHNGRIAEMATGEGKTLVATFPTYLNALTGRGVHVVTVNDYLAARDSEWMGAVYRLLGLSVGVILHDMPPDVRREQYRRDITYGTNAEFGFDYLRDNGMADRKELQVQREHYFAIVDEVDSILIDEARTPLIISGPAVVNADNQMFNQMKPSVTSVVHAQEKLCARFLKEAAELAEQLHPKDGSNPQRPEELELELGLRLYRVKIGNPRSEGLARLLEDPSNASLMQKAELRLHADQSKKDLYSQKEELFYAMDEKTHEADLTEKGREFLSPEDPETFVLPDLAMEYHRIDTDPALNIQQRLEAKSRLQAQLEVKAQRIHVIAQLLKAYSLYLKDVHYVVQEGKVIIVDENTGRLMTGRRWSDGLHAAVEAKEGVEVEKETQTYATITIQNYFRLYKKLAGMTGTAETEANEFFDIYKLGVIVVPTNKPCLRKDSNDTVYKTKREKFTAVLREIKEVHAQGRPILVGTVSVDTSEQLSRMLKKEGIVHSVLNAKYHQQEAEIVARAGQRGGVTIATNMAGRGTDIKLGAGIAEVGGLHVIGTERHESRRIDRQLRGRCARQGDPGSSHFFIALEDDLMRLFGSDRIVKVMERVGLEENQELEHPFLNRSIEQSQKRVEQQNFQIRKRTLEYDDVMNKQRAVIYGFRHEILHSEDVRDRLMDVMEEVVIAKIDQFTSPTTDSTEWNIRALSDWINLNFPIGVAEDQLIKIAESGSETPVAGSAFDGLSAGQFALCRHIIEEVRQAYTMKVSYENLAHLVSIERYTVLNAIDKLWQEHLYHMDSLRNSISLRAYGQRDPLLEYKVEAFKVFEELMVNIKSEICHNIFRSASSMQAFQDFLRNLQNRSQATHPRQGGFGQAQDSGSSTGSAASSDVVGEASEAIAKSMPVRTGPKVGRNDPCPCGSGKKYKLCCGRS
ncbi:MAG: preprotein translocase subunit SecA [Verrucomicrobia bacterium]|nr:preprotein translocase subunit SecA [Verrucomicrobiota bacterium]